MAIEKTCIAPPDTVPGTCVRGAGTEPDDRAGAALIYGGSGKRLDVHPVAPDRLHMEDVSGGGSTVSVIRIVCCACGPGTASVLSRQLPVTRQAVAEHLLVLERTGLVSSQPVGRERTGTTWITTRFARAAAQLAVVGQARDGRSHRIRTIAESIQRAAGTVVEQKPDHDR